MTITNNDATYSDQEDDDDNFDNYDVCDDCDIIIIYDNFVYAPIDHDVTAAGYNGVEYLHFVRVL